MSLGSTMDSAMGSNEMVEFWIAIIDARLKLLMKSTRATKKNQIQREKSVSKFVERLGETLSISHEG